MRTRRFVFQGKTTKIRARYIVDRSRRHQHAEAAMTAAERVLTDEMIEQIRAYFPRYPTKQAVTLPGI